MRTTAKITVELEWWVDQADSKVYRSFWDKFQPKMFISNSVDTSSEDIFKDETADNTLYLVENGGLHLTVRHFKIARTVDVTLHQRFDLRAFPSFGALANRSLGTPFGYGPCTAGPRGWYAQSAVWDRVLLGMQ